MSNILILGKYGAKTALDRLAALAAAPSDDVVRIIVKEGDEAPDSALIARHHRNMQGDVCDLLWEAASLDQKAPLIIASERGFWNQLRLESAVSSQEGAEVSVWCSESTFAGFKFDADGRVCESADLPASVPYIVRFAHTETFTDAAEDVILQHKSEKDGKFGLHSVVNQLILQKASIDVAADEFGDLA